MNISLKELCEYEGIPDVNVSGLVLNSNDVRESCIFAAFRGEKHNGEDFIQDAVSRGAICVIMQGDSDSCCMQDGTVFITSRNPRKLASQMAVELYRTPKMTIAAVTGTNGKTSSVEFLRQIWAASGRSSASIGTLGVKSTANGVVYEPSLTSLDCVSLNKLLSTINVDNVAMEASSHGLDQYRMYGLDFSVVAFTNFTQDHLDYHGSMREYWDAKSKLFSEYASESTVCVLNADSDQYTNLQKLCSGKKIVSYGIDTGDLSFSSIEATSYGYRAFLRIYKSVYRLAIPIHSRFQLSNILCAASMGYATGVKEQDIAVAIESLSDVDGRMQFVAEYNGASIYVDYAHTPDGLETVLKDMKNRSSGRIIVVFGCGGCRDKSKRALMGKVAADNADIVIITDDNPRTENPAAIRHDIKEGCSSAIEIEGRRNAIKSAIEMLQSDDILLVVGKGHEKYQIIGTEKHNFSDFDEIVTITSRG